MNYDLSIINELRVQAMVFDMDIDIETMSLVPKTESRTPEWLKKWKEKVHNGDNHDPRFEVDLE